MPQKISPFLWFDHQAEEAAKFYVSVFKKGSKILKVSRYGEAGPGPKGTVMVVDFQIQGQRFSALNGGPLFQFNESVSFVVHCESQREIDYFWQKLTEDGGSPSQCGWLKDKYGLSWQIVPKGIDKLFGSKDAARANRFMQAMLQMGKLDMAVLEAAAKGPAKARAKKKR